jgi:PAS domain S-box-containing protein
MTIAPPVWLDGGLALLDGLGGILTVNPVLAEWLGKAAFDLEGQTLETVLAGRCAAWREAWLRLDAAGQTFAEAQWEIAGSDIEPTGWFKVELTRHAAGKLFRLASRLPPLQDLQEEGADAVSGSEPGRRERFFRSVRAEEQLERLIQRWPGIVFGQRPDGSFSFVSPKIEDLTGVPASDWERQTGRFWDVIHEADLQQVQQQLKQAARSALPLTSTFRVRHLKTGKVSYILEHRQAVSTGNGLLLGYEGAWLDLTRQTLVEKRLNAAAWKETLAALTMGLAHDFRNVMAGIVGLTEAFQSQLDEKHPFREGLSLIRSNAWQASQSIQRILQLYQGQSGERSYQDLNELVQEMVDMSRKMLSRRITLETRLAEGRLPVYVDAFEFRQAFLNLAVNARDAMAQGGKLTIETTRHQAQPQPGFVRGTLPRLPAICLSLADTGSGISEQHLASIFDPFFTTKALDKGSGLGLYNVLLFVEKHQGAISVDSKEGQGATFHLWLPEADFSESERLTQPAAEHHTLLLLGGRGQALDATAEFLRHNGFYVVLATHPSAALDYLRSPHYQFAGVMLQTTAQCPEFFADIKNEKLSVKTILQVIGCNPDELDTALLQGADLVLAADAPGNQLAAKIRSLFPGPA